MSHDPSQSNPPNSFSNNQPGFGAPSGGGEMYSGPPQGNNWGTPPPPQKSRSVWWWIFGGCGCLAFLAAATIGACSYFGYNFFAGPIKVMEQNMELLKSGDIDKAYSETINPDAMTLEEFKTFVTTQNLENCKEHNFGNINIQNNYADIDVSVVNSKGESINIKFVLSQKGDEWKIDGLSIE